MYEELVKSLRETDFRDGCPCGAEHLCQLYADNNKDCVIFQAADAIEDLIAALTASNEVIAKSKPCWIPVTERLPEPNTRVIGFMAWKSMTAIEYQHGKWYSIDHLEPLPDAAVTHWMPLPEPPKEET